ncbi:MAG: DUF2591 domain-containing protein [Burkholderiaceae bacterium]|nr:MAG: DUF2591 domain-containing protein [Burkholderiaceae bacterium]TBR76656.1 MAG: DUF2591 domain-containing protein [Burkholderiaceae bacterium]
MDLVDAALDWAVIVAEHGSYDPNKPEHVAHFLECRSGHPMHQQARYSERWDHAGPIIAREGIDFHQIKHHPYGIYEYRADRAALPGAVVVARPMLQGPGRWVRVPKPPGPNEGKWLARMAVDHHPFGWSKNDFMSPTPLIAAMRCYVASKFGESVQVPEELLNDARSIQLSDEVVSENAESPAAPRP